MKKETEASSTEKQLSLSPVEESPSGIPQNFPIDLSFGQYLIIDRNGKAYIQVEKKGSAIALKVGSKQSNNWLRTNYFQKVGKSLKAKALEELNEILIACAEAHNNKQDVWIRIAQIPGGIEIDCGDDNHTRVRITAGNVCIVEEESQTIFYRPPSALPMAIPAAKGNIRLLKKYINIAPHDRTLLIAWIMYTLAHPKVSTSKYVILALNGEKGSGKSSLCTNVISRIIDPSQICIQTLPKNEKDLAIATHGSHVLFFDNIRKIYPSMSDTLCIAATGGAISGRKLYTDDEQTFIRLHGALVLNGIRSFLEQPDLAQRALPLQMQVISPQQRKQDADMVAEFEADLPQIMRGLFNMIAKIFEQLPTVEVTNPERMISFSRWLAALEKVQQKPAGYFQKRYSKLLNQGQLDVLMDNPLASAIIEFAEQMDGNEWVGTPTELLDVLEMSIVSHRTSHSGAWPSNAIALSKRLIPIQAGLLTQGINVKISRGKHRKITLTVAEEGV